MSGASANAAARRRRGVSQQSTNNYTTQDTPNPKINTNNSNVPTLTVPQILMQLDKRISLIENKFNTPSESMLDINGNIDVKLFPQRFGELDKKIIDVEQKISGLENNITENVITRLNNFASSITALETKIDSVNVSNNNDSVSKEEFNKIMGNVGDDVGVLTDQVGDLKDLVLNIQNSTILLDKTIIEINNEFRSNKSDIIKAMEREMEKEMEQHADTELTTIDEVEEETSTVLEQDNQEINNDDEKKKETENIELQVQEKEITQDEIKEEVSVVVNDELIKKLKMLNSVSSEDDKLKEENNEA
tara:strand:- start:125 stop:1039 length:915 start_codon:yes stop_codon:yes gene_type:complete